MNALKCYIEVTAGIVPEVPEQRHTRRWEFTQKDLDDRFVFSDGSGSAMNYAMALQNPGQCNWVNFKWVWL